MQIELSLINKLLTNLDNLKASGFKDISSEHTNVRESGYEGSFDEYEYYYSHLELPNDVFLKVVRQTDSYGDNEFTKSIQFVIPVIKEVTKFEAIK